MTDPDQHLAEAVFRHYSVGSPRAVRFIPSGLIHRTYCVETEQGHFILQRLHPDLSSDALLADYRAVTDYLADQHFPGPNLLVTRSGELTVLLDGYRHRLMTYLEGISHDEVRDDAMAGEAGQMLGRFHVSVSEFRYTFKSNRPLHDSAKHFEAFQKIVSPDALKKLAGTIPREDVATMTAVILDEFPRHFLPCPLPSRIVHGDPKISNVLFDPSSGRAVGMVDLDSCARHTVLVDLGDAVRSWCREGREDQPTPFLPNRFRALLVGYLSAQASLSQQERSLIVQACHLITLEMTSRFLRDIVEDRYFGWDAGRYSSRAEHNFARACGMFALYRSMLDYRTDMDRIVAQL